MKDGTPDLRFAFNTQGDKNDSELTSFVVALPRKRGLRFNRAEVAKGTACHGPGKWKSSPINRTEMRCTPLVPYVWAKGLGPEVVTNIRISAIHESSVLEQKVKEHKLTKLHFDITAKDSKHGTLHFGELGKIEN
jgi:hypothetical protein